MLCFRNIFCLVFVIPIYFIFSCCTAVPHNWTGYHDENLTSPIRSKRASAAGVTCSKPKIDDAIEDTLKSCSNKKPGEACHFECKAGYEEENPRILCQKNSFSWPSDAKCTRKECGAGPFRIISLQTPQLSKFYDPSLGKYVTIYSVLFDTARKLPLWSIAMHEANMFESKSYNAAKDFKRYQRYSQHPCMTLSNAQGQLNYYKKSGWDHGHLTPANIARWSVKAITAINFYINLAPQDSKTNRGPWRNLEAHIECFSEDSPSLIATGVSLDNATVTTKADGIIVPKYFWKMICYKDKNEKEQVVGFKHTNEKADRSMLDREIEVYNPLDQKDVKAIMTKGSLPNIDNPWTMDNTLYSGRKVAKKQPDRTKCAQALTLPEAEKKTWDLFVDKKRKRNNNDCIPRKKRNQRGKRQNDNEVKRGCHRCNQLEDKLKLMSYYSNSDEEVEEAPSIGVSCKKRLVGYYTSWGDAEISSSHMERLTHVIWATMEVSSDGNIPFIGGKVDEIVVKRLEKLLTLARLFPHLKVMFAVGSSTNSQHFSSIAASKDRKRKLMDSVVKIIDTYGFDGVDINWVYPTTLKDKENFVMLMKELRKELDEIASTVKREEKFLLSFASAAGKRNLDTSYDLPGLLSAADFVNVMSHDFLGSWESEPQSFIGTPSPLYFGSSMLNGTANADWTMHHYACKSKLSHKINMGVPFYGRFWSNVKTDEMWQKVEAVKGRIGGDIVPWYDIQRDYLDSGTFDERFDERSKTPYAWSKNTGTFLGYENEMSLTHKKDYLLAHNIGGFAIWAVDQDDVDLTLLNTLASESFCRKTSSDAITNYDCP